jgi:hypothetical protein
MAHGTASPNRRLFILSNFFIHFPQNAPGPSSAHYSSHLPGINTWHRCLGHCGSCAIINMAHTNAVEGMLINISTPPSKCEHCILRKQTCSSVSRVREGARASKPLEHVYVDLCGPMAIPSRSGRLYSMNIIDNYSSFVWTLSLHSKDEAAPFLKIWLTALEVQTPYCLQSFITDNGELTSSQIHAWCAQKGILHLLTAPYTSAHNGHAKCLHHTLFDKAHSMLSACTTPTNMWDKFCTTAAHLTNLMGASTNSGKTPYQLWHNCKPSLSHLREIGCRTFTLIPTNNPKIHHCSVPCTLIEYAPNSKAYCL